MQIKGLHSIPVFLPPISGSYLCLYIWEKINTFFVIFGNIYTKFGKIMPFLETVPDSSVGRVSAPGKGRSRVRSPAATYQSR